MPLLERVRVEVYIPDPHVTEYDNLLRSFEYEFTYAFGDVTAVRDRSNFVVNVRLKVMVLFYKR